jgi:molybdopterin molybdotransferase
MISIQEAVNIVIKNIPPPEIEQVELKNSLGKRLAEDIFSAFPSPRFDNSMVDGYAVKWDDYLNKKELKIIGESRAGISFKGEAKSGETIAVSTGAQIPEGCDTVVPVEEIERSGDWIRIKTAKEKSQNIRFVGEEYKAGKLLLTKETKLSSSKIALLASAGKFKVKIFKAPFVSIIATGTELNIGPAELKKNKIYDSNTLMLTSAVEECGGKITLSAVVEDDLFSTIELLKRAEEISDIIIFTGGVSVGEHDYVKHAAGECGYTELFWGVKQKPGKPLYFAVKNGVLRDKLLFGLPGNPASAYVCFFHYAAQVIYKLSSSEFLSKKLYIISSDTVTNNRDRAEMLRVKLINVDNCLKFKILDKQSSYMITSISEADGYIIVEENQTVEKDSSAEIFLFPCRW